VNCIAHRGFAAIYPENTLTAIERAVAAGTDGIEVDVRRCGSGEVVVVHDETLDRVTDGSGAVADHSLAELRDLDVLGTGEGIPTLAEVVTAVPDDTLLNVELKEEGVTADAVGIAADHGGDLLISSFDPAALETARDVGAESLALIFATDARGSLADASDLGCRAVHPHRKLCDAQFVDRCHGTGFAVNAWTIESHDHGSRLRGIGVDGLIADAPDYCGLDREIERPDGDETSNATRETGNRETI